MSATEGAGHIAMSHTVQARTCTRRLGRFVRPIPRNHGAKYAYRKKAACMNLSRRAPNASRPECSSTQVRISGVFSMRQNATHLRQALRSLRFVFGLAERSTAAPTSRIIPRSIPGSFGHSAKRDVSDCNASKRSP